MEVSWRRPEWSGWEIAAWGGLVTDWALWSTILVSAASQIIKRDGNLWHSVVTSHLSATGAPLSGSQTLVTEVLRHQISYFLLFLQQSAQKGLQYLATPSAKSIQCHGTFEPLNLTVAPSQRANHEYWRSILVKPTLQYSTVIILSATHFSPTFQKLFN